MNSVNSQNLNKGGKVKAQACHPLLWKISLLFYNKSLDIRDKEQEQARAEQIQSLTEKSESTINNTTTQEIKTKGEEQVKVLTSILEAIKEQKQNYLHKYQTLYKLNVNNSTINSSANQPIFIA